MDTWGLPISLYYILYTCIYIYIVVYDTEKKNYSVQMVFINHLTSGVYQTTLSFVIILSGDENQRRKPRWASSSRRLSFTPVVFQVLRVGDAETARIWKWGSIFIKCPFPSISRVFS